MKLHSEKSSDSVLSFIFKIVGATVIILIGAGILVSIILFATGGNGTSNNVTEPAITEQVEFSPPEIKLDFTKLYNSVQAGMNKDEVLALADGIPPDCTESTSEFGVYEHCQWNDFSGDAVTYVAIQFTNGAVESKSKGGF